MEGSNNMSDNMATYTDLEGDWSTLNQEIQEWTATGEFPIVCYWSIGDRSIVKLLKLIHLWVVLSTKQRPSSSRWCHPLFGAFANKTTQLFACPSHSIFALNHRSIADISKSLMASIFSRMWLANLNNNSIGIIGKLKKLLSLLIISLFANQQIQSVPMKDHFWRHFISDSSAWHCFSTRWWCYYYSVLASSLIKHHLGRRNRRRRRQEKIFSKLIIQMLTVCCLFSFSQAPCQLHYTPQTKSASSSSSHDTIHKTSPHLGAY